MIFTRKYHIVVKRGENMLITNDMIKENFGEYRNKNNKISRETKKGNYLRLKNGLYETDSTVLGYYLAGAIYGPSYLSFDFALSFYNLIPEGVKNYTSATFNKKKKKIYTNYFGTYIYRDVPTNVYNYGIKIIEENGYFYQIATPEKALCDKLYTISPVSNLDELEKLLFDNLRIDKEEFKKLDINFIEKIRSIYMSTNVTFLYKYMRVYSNK